MGLLTCKDCGGAVSSRAKACPSCGAPVSVPVLEQAGRTAAGCFAIIFITIVIVFAFLPTKPERSGPQTERNESPPAQPAKKPAQSPASDDWGQIERTALAAQIVVLQDAVRIAGVRVAVAKDEQDKLKAEIVAKYPNAEDRLKNHPFRIELDTLQSELDRKKARLIAAERAYEARFGGLPEQKKPDDVKAARGAALHREIITRHRSLDPYYGRIDTALSAISLPVDDWERLSQNDRDVLGHYMEKQCAGYWKIHVGEISPDGQDVRLDRTALDSAAWRKN